MLTGKDLGAALKTAMKLKGVTQQDVATEFDVMQPSVSAWVRTGRISKEHLNHLMRYFANVVGPEHWGITVAADYKALYEQAAQAVGQELAAPPAPEFSVRALSLARRFDALPSEEHQRIAYALMDNALQQFEALSPPSARRAVRRPERVTNTPR